MITVESPRGKTVTIADRENTCDLSIIGGTFYLWGKTDDEYGLADQYPRTFLDIGGHIGVVTLAVLVDNPECRAVILEPLPENIAAIKYNLGANGVLDRARIVHGAIGAGASSRIGYQLPRVENAPTTDYYVGGTVDEDFKAKSVTALNYSLKTLLDLLGDTVDLAKTDCEGCEYTLFGQLGVDRVKRWVGEYHPGGTLDLLRMTHDLTLAPHGQGGTGNFVAVRR